MATDKTVTTAETADPAASFRRNSEAIAATWSPEIQAYAAALAEEITFERRLRDFRALFGLTQRELALIINEDQADISKLERGGLNPSVDRMNSILARMRASAESQSAAPEPATVEQPRRYARAILSDAHDAAAYFRAIYDDHDIEFTNLKLQKLLYYAQGYALVLFGRPLFPERIKAWAYGPVVPQVRKTFEEFDNAVLPRPEDLDLIEFDAEARKVLDRVYAEFGHLAAWALVDVTHQEAPWKETAQNDEIDRARIEESCRQRMGRPGGAVLRQPVF